MHRLYTKIINNNNNSDVKETNPITNWVLLQLLLIEARAIPAIKIPFGLSIVCVAKKV